MMDKWGKTQRFTKKLKRQEMITVLLNFFLIPWIMFKEIHDQLFD